MKLTKRHDGWHITGIAPYHVDGERFDTYGPYSTKSEADDDRRGLARFYREYSQYVDIPADSPNLRK
jgi:hypothetical protein